MEVLVREISAKLGMDQAVARAALGSLLVYVMHWADGDDWSELISKLPAAENLLATASESLVVNSGGRMIVNEGIIDPLRRSGLAFAEIPPVAEMFLDCIKANAGHPLAGRITGAVPSLKALATLDVKDESPDVRWTKNS